MTKPGRLLWPSPVVYCDQARSSIVTKPGRLLWPSPVVYYGQARSSIVTKPGRLLWLTLHSQVCSTRPEGAEALSPGQRPGLFWTQTCRPVRAKALKLTRKFIRLLPLQGDLLIAFIPRALPWAKSFCPYRACCSLELLGLQPVLESHAKVQLVFILLA